MDEKEVPNSIPEEYTPLGMWEYLGYSILFNLPCIGFILILIFSFGGQKNINLKNFARSYLCGFVIALILVILVVILLGVAGYQSASSMMNAFAY